MMKRKAKPAEPAAEGMTDRQAETQAKKLWGANGAVWHHAYSKKSDWDYYRVGLAIGDVRDNWKVLGRGRSWLEAFADAQRHGYC